jgi:hypothetical protein
MTVSDAEIARTCKRRHLPRDHRDRDRTGAEGSVGQGPDESESSTIRAADTVASCGLRFWISSASPGTPTGIRARQRIQPWRMPYPRSAAKCV